MPIHNLPIYPLTKPQNILREANNLIASALIRLEVKPIHLYINTFDKQSYLSFT